jgi:hypothetical protein
LTQVPPPRERPAPPRTFLQWLDSPEGRDCANPRLPTDYTRLSVELEDRLRRAYEAGGAR